MSRAIEHRGPDSIGHWTGGPVGLSNLLLQTVAQSAQEKQPLVSADGLRCLTMDGRIDNREELRRDLESKGFRIRHETDAELVLCAYEQWGEECPIRLLGDFAIRDLGRKQEAIILRARLRRRPALLLPLFAILVCVWIGDSGDPGIGGCSAALERIQARRFPGRDSRPGR